MRASSSSSASGGLRHPRPVSAFAFSPDGGLACDGPLTLSAELLAPQTHLLTSGLAVASWRRSK